jgi:hypothetical protein
MCPAFMGEISPLLYRLLVTACHAQKWSKVWRLLNLWRPPKISLVLTKPSQFLSLLIGVLSKNRKNLNNHIAVQYQLSYSQPPGERLS